MPYCQPSDVIALNQLFTSTDFPDDVVQVYITKAQSRIDNLLQPVYVVPLADPVPDIILSITADMAACLMCQNNFSEISYREDTPLAEVYRKRAEADLQHVITYATLDGLSGIVKRIPDVPEMRQKIASSTPHPNHHLQRRMKEFGWATQSPISNVIDSLGWRR